MADPRLSYDNIEVGAVFASYKYDNSTITYSATTSGGSSQVGLAVTLTSTQYVIETVGDAEFVLGKLIKVEADGTCVVQVGGYMALAGGDGATLTEGKAIVGDLGAAAAEGYIREVDTAAAAELGVCKGWIDDPTTTTAVVVCL